jgi:outer membrane protein assembly factor BamB
MGFLMRSRLLSLAALLLIAGCGGLRMERYLHSRPDDWPTFARTAGHTASASGTLSPPLNLAWTQDIAAGMGNGSPVVVDSIVFVGNLRGELCALSVATGKQIGSMTLGEAIQGSPVIDGSVAFVPLSNSQQSITAIDLFQGKPLWKKSYGDVEVTPCIFNQKIFFGNTAGTFFSIERATGEVRWKFELPDNTTFKGIRSSPAADSGTIVFGADDGKVYAFEAETGARMWTFDTGAPVLASPLIASGTVFVGNRLGTFFALNLSSGRPAWQSRTGAPIYANGVPAGDIVIVGNLAGEAMGFRKSDGMLVWRTDLGGPITAGGAVAGSTVYIGTLKKQIYGLNPEDGAITWKAETGGRIRTSPAAAFGRLFVVTDEHDLLAFREAK